MSVEFCDLFGFFFWLSVMSWSSIALALAAALSDCVRTDIWQPGPRRALDGNSRCFVFEKNEKCLMSYEFLLCLIWGLITYLPHKAVAEGSKDKEPIGRECAEFSWFESQLMSDSNELRVKWFGCHLIWDSNGFCCQLVWESIDSDLVVNWFEIQMIWLSTDVCFKWFWLSVDLNFKWCGCQWIWDSSDSVVNWSAIQVMWSSIDLRFKWVGCQLIWDSNDLDVKWFEVQVIWLSTDVWFKWFCQTKLLCETCFKMEALKLKNEAFLRDFLQKRSFEDQKWSFSARLPSKTKRWSSKTKLLCETSFKKESLKIKNEAFLRDFL